MKVKLNQLTKCFGEHKVLDAIDFEDEITTLAIIGTSGGGKSTLLRILGGLIEATDGQAVINGQCITEKGASLLEYRRKIGFVFQQNGLLKHLTALQNVTMPLIKVHGYSKEKAEERAMELLNHFGLKKEAGKRPIALSGGQNQRIAIARAIAPNPKFLLLDEPTSALDPEYTIAILNMIQELKQEKMDFIIVTHEMGFARHACEKTMFLNDGRILEYGKSEEIFSEPKTPQLKHFLDNLLEWNVVG